MVRLLIKMMSMLSIVVDVFEEAAPELSPWWLPCAEWRKLPRTSQGRPEMPPRCPLMTSDLDVRRFDG